MLAVDLPPGAGGQRVEVLPGAVVGVRVPDPDTLLRQIAGEEAGGPVVALGRTDLRRLPPEARWQAGLAVVTCRVPPLPGAPLLEVVLLGDRWFRASALAAALGTRRARAERADADARVRALAGRIGLARWLDHPVSDAPAEAAALADVARGMLAAPHALVVRDPDWLRREDRARVGRALLTEGRRLGAAVLTVSGPPAGDRTLPRP